MESTEELQQQEITVLKSIYGDDFQECPPPTVWKGAARLPEFMIKVSHPEDPYASRCFLYLVVTLPKSYPTKASPTFTIKDAQGLLGKVGILTRAVQQEAKKNQGSEMVFQIVTFVQEWLADNVQLPMEGSLRYQMERRNMEEEQARLEREEAEVEKENLRAMQLAEELSEQIREDTLRQQLELDQIQRSRRRGMSDATQVPMSPISDTPTETFLNDIEWEGVTFNTVKLFHPRKECVGTVYLAEPVCDDIHTSLPLELVVTVFDSEYYSTSQGRKKLKQIESEMLKLINVRHPNLLSVFAVKLMTPHSDHPRLVILMEERPSLCLQDVLEDCDTLKEERASEYLRQILTGLYALHMNDIIHRGLSLRTVFLANSMIQDQPKAVKLGKTGYWVRLLDLYKSNPFTCDITSVLNDFKIPEAWLPKDVVDSPLIYTKSRDIYSVGVIVLQMLLGRDVMNKFMIPRAALQSPSLPQRVVHHVSNMFSQTKKNGVSCSSLLAELAESSAYRSTSVVVTIPAAPKTPTVRQPPVGSPDDYFVPRMRPRPNSRWRDEFEELELLGRGAYGSVVKARHKMDGGIYAVKKIKLRDSKKSGDGKLLREVSALRQLSHRYIVRYYTTWTESSEIRSATASDSESDAETVDGITSMPHSRSKSRTGSSENLLSLDLNDFTTNSSRSSFPSIHFGGPDDSSEGSSEEVENDEDGEDGLKNLFDPIPTPKPMYPTRFVPVIKTPTQAASTSRTTLYIQMEFVEQQTLKERIADGLTEEEAWRLFQQIVEALVHISSHGILHRDIKLTNIFIDAKGDCKIGDFGLATSSLAAVDPTDKSPHIGLLEDLTLDVGTKLYMAPEATARLSKLGPQDQKKADMYSLGIVFFEMNYSFTTGAERIAVLEDLRKPGIFFPSDWEAHRDRQKQIITSLLQHDPMNRQSALQLSQSPLLPHLLQDDNFQRALKMIAMRDSSHHEAVLSTLFDRTTKPSRAFLFYSGTEPPEHAPLFDMVQEKLKVIFRLHGAIDQEPPLLTPVLTPEDEVERTVLLDRRGQVVSLPTNGLTQFARLGARNNNQRIKRFHFFSTYRPNPAGHPYLRKTALFDIITPDLENGPGAAIAESIAIVHECFKAFPKLKDAHEIHISHSKIVQIALARIPEDLRPAVIEILTEPKLTTPQRRAMLLKKGLLKSTVDELEVLDSKDDWMDTILPKVDRVSRPLASLIRPAINEISEALERLELLGVPAKQSVIFHPLMLGSTNQYSDGVCFEVIRPGRRSDALASGGRYDDIMNQFYTPDQVVGPTRAMVLQISLDRIAASVVAFQKAAAHTILREPKSFGFWSPRRCDVYIVSYTPGHLNDRLEVAALLWKNGISADLMYEAAIANAGQEDHLDVCDVEGILFTVYPRPRSARRDQPAFKVKSVLKGTEYDVARHDLVPWLQEKIADQKRIDANTSGVERLIVDNSVPISVTSSKDIGSRDVQLVLPGDLKKGRGGPKQLFADRAFEMSTQIKQAIQSGLPTLAVDVPDAAFELMSKNSDWITDENPEAWKTIHASFPAQQSAYAYQIREAIGKRKEDGCRFVLLFAVRSERICLLELA